MQEVREIGQNEAAELVGLKQGVEAVKFLWKRKHFEERRWKQKRTRKHLTF